MPETSPAKPGRAATRETLKLGRPILDKNDRLAARNRAEFRRRGIFVINVLSSPGSGKTTLIRETLCRLGRRLRCAVVVGDLATDNDARRLRESGAPAVQITTGTMCHLEADLVARAVKQLDVANLDLLIIENVGNLVCPASFDLGENLRVVLHSVAEGEDKPLKYPPMFHTANVVIVSKADLSAACDFKRDIALENIRHVAPAAQVFELSAKTGAGLDEWCDYLVGEQQKLKQLNKTAPSAN